MYTLTIKHKYVLMFSVSVVKDIKQVLQTQATEQQETSRNLTDLKVIDGDPGVGREVL